jgi:hypothetical protein
VKTNGIIFTACRQEPERRETLLSAAYLRPKAHKLKARGIRFDRKAHIAATARAWRMWDSEKQIQTLLKAIKTLAKGITAMKMNQSNTTQQR